MTRARTFPYLIGAAVAALALLSWLLYLDTRPHGPELPTPDLDKPAERPLRVYCAAALRVVIEKIAAEYRRETVVGVDFDFGDSGAMLGNATVRPDGDIFLPADDSYIRSAEARGLVALTVPLAHMRAVILTRPGNPYAIATFNDLLRNDIKLGMANPDRAAIGKVVRDRLRAIGKWNEFAARIHVQHTTVTDSANAVQLGSTDAAVVWDVVAMNYPELTVVHVPELDGAVGRVELAVLKSAPDPAAARRFARYIGANDRGLSQFRKAGFERVETAAPWVDPGSRP